jgi:hypothetical protein
MTLREALERSESHMKRLEPAFQEKVARWFRECFAKKVFVLIYCSSRTPEEQEKLYAQGRTKPGQKVTNARGIPPQSLHIDLGKGARAIDFVPIAQSGTGWQIAWEDKETYAIAHKMAEASGGLRRLDWEEPHLEDASVSGWRELVAPQKTETKTKKRASSKKPWAGSK